MTDITSCYFTSLTAPDAFFAIRLGADTWTAATDANKTKALQMATWEIDNLPLQGFALLSTQARAFPRKYLPTDSSNPWGNTHSEDPYGYIYESSSVPQVVLDACCLEALALLDFHSSTSTAMKARKSRIDQGVKSYSLGDRSESYGVAATGNSTFDLKSKGAYDLLSSYIDRRGDIR